MPGHRLRTVLGVALLVLGSQAAPAGPSPFLLDRQFGTVPEFGYRFQHPHLAGEVDADLLLGSHEVSAALPVGGDLTVWLALPLIRWGIAEIDLADESAWGNATLGLQARRLGRRENLTLNFGLQLPTAQEAHYSLGLLGLLAEPFRWQTFVPDVLTIQGSCQAEVPVTPEAAFRCQLGPDLLVATGDGDGSTTLHLRYGLGVAVQTGRVGASVEFAGFWETDGDGDGFREDSHHVLAAGITYVGPVVQPSLYYEIPTDERFADVLEGVLGVRLVFMP